MRDSLHRYGAPLAALTTRRQFLGGVAAGVAAVAATGCAPQRPKDLPGVVTLEFYNYATPEFLALYNEKLIPAFEKKHPNIRIRMNSSLGDAEYDAKLLTLIAGRLAPDLFHVTQQNFPFYAAKDILLPIDDLMKDDPDLSADAFFPQVTMNPTFVLWTTPGWADSLKPLIIPSFFGSGAFFVFLLRQFFLTLPAELEDAVKLDGCTSWGIFHVAVPMAKPALTTIALFSFIGHWNDFLGPLIYTQSMEKKTLAVGLTAFMSLHGTEHHLLMAASVVVLLTILVVFFCAQRYFVEGIAAGAVKGWEFR